MVHHQNFLLAQKRKTLVSICTFSFGLKKPRYKCKNHIHTQSADRPLRQKRNIALGCCCCLALSKSSFEVLRAKLQIMARKHFNDLENWLLFLASDK